MAGAPPSERTAIVRCDDGGGPTRDGIGVDGEG